MLKLFAVIGLAFFIVFVMEIAGAALGFGILFGLPGVIFGVLGAVLGGIMGLMAGLIGVIAGLIGVAAGLFGVIAFIAVPVLLIMGMIALFRACF